MKNHLQWVEKVKATAGPFQVLDVCGCIVRWWKNGVMDIPEIKHYFSISTNLIELGDCLDVFDAALVSWEGQISVQNQTTALIRTGSFLTAMRNFYMLPSHRSTWLILIVMKITNVHVIQLTSSNYIQGRSLWTILIVRTSQSYVLPIHVH